MPQFPENFIGTVGFQDTFARPASVIRRLNDMVIEFEDDGWTYTVNMNSSDGVGYRGGYTARKGGLIETGDASGSIYSAGKQRLFFGRRWSENNQNYWWFVDLEE